jgi:hypothetical protein
MNLLRIFTLGLFTLLFSCGKSDPSKVEFEGRTFELPIKVKAAKEKLGLQYGYYSGFFNGNVNDKTILTQLENYPVFAGSDNDKEESYSNHNIVGVTFFKSDKTLEEYKDMFERKYNKIFKSEIKGFGVTRTLPPFNMTFHYIKTDDDLYIALKEIVRKASNKKYISISFYEGISKSDLGEFLVYV